MFPINVLIYKNFLCTTASKDTCIIALHVVFPHNARGQTTIRPHVLCLTQWLFFIAWVECVHPLPPTTTTQESSTLQICREIYRARDSTRKPAQIVILED